MMFWRTSYVTIVKRNVRSLFGGAKSILNIVNVCGLVCITRGGLVFIDAHSDCIIYVHDLINMLDGESFGEVAVPSLWFENIFELW